ncbi:MAG: MFS transporter [Coriobacteriia bacterium]|nr:MFS transporter [Coriobacteriia bacterium]
MPFAKHYHWVVAFCCFLLVFCNVGLPSTSFNVYQPYIVALPGVGDSAGSVVITVRTFVSLLCMFAVARYYELLDCRLGAAIASVFTVACLLLFGFADSFPLLCVASALGGVGYGLGGMVCTTYLINRWFKTDVGTAVGFAAVGSGVASIVIPVCAEWIIRTFSLSVSFWVEALLAAIIGITVFALLRDKPSDLGMEPYVSPKWVAKHQDEVVHGSDGVDMPVDHGVSLPVGPKRAFILVTMIVGATCVSAANFLGVFLVSGGYDHAFAALMLSVCGLVLTIGKFGMGRIFDGLGGLKGSVIALVTFIAGMTLLCLGAAGNVALIWAGTILFAFGLSIGSTGIPIWSLHFSTPDERVKTVRTFQLGYAAGSFLFTMVPGVLKDLMGSYVVSYVIMTAMMAVALAIIVVVYKKYQNPSAHVS